MLNTHASTEAKELFGRTDYFSNPKPIKLIKHIVNLGTNSDSIILDFFSGSATTAHAVMKLNAEDGGNRKFILCTNNENNICTEVTYPRIKKVTEGYADVSGIPTNLKYYTQTFVPVITSDNDKRKLVNCCTEMLCIAENCFELVRNRDCRCDFSIFKNAKKQMVIIYDEDSICDCIAYLNEHKSNNEFVIYVFSYDHTYASEDFEELAVEGDESYE